MKIWIINQYAIPPAYPGGTRHYSLAKALIEQGHDVCVIAGNFNHNSYQKVTYSHYPFGTTQHFGKVPFCWINVPPYNSNSPMRILNMLFFALNLLRFSLPSRLKRPDIIIGSSPTIFAAYAGKIVSKFLGVSFVYEIRDIWPDALIQLGKLSKHHPYACFLRKIHNSLLSISDGIICNLAGWKHDSTKFNATDKILWLPNFIDFDLIPKVTDKRETNFTILYAGSFNQANDLYTIIKAAEIVQMKKHKNITFNLVGDGPEKPNLIALASKLNLQQVNFKPPIPKSKIYEEIQCANVCISLRLKKDISRVTSSLKVPDYMSMSKPVIFCGHNPSDPTSQCQGAVKISAEDPEELANVIISLSKKSSAELNNMGKLCREFVENRFNCRPLAIKLSNFLQNIYIH